MADAADILRNFHELQALPRELHWFCPRENRHDTGLYFNEDLVGAVDYAIDDEQRTKKVEAAKSRQAKVFDAVQIFAFDGKDAELAQQWIESCIGAQMRQCDICVREYHRGRRDLQDKLKDAYDEEDVTAFLSKFDDINLRRIEDGLASATKQLKDLPTEKRGISALDRGAIHSIFEAFNCTPFHTDEVKLSLHFDEFFHLVQTNKFLKLSSYSSAMFHFLYGESKDRTLWASKALQKFKRNLTAEEFDSCVREPLLTAVSRVQLEALQKEFLQQFWEGTRLIVGRLDKALITHSLRALDALNIAEVDLSRLAFSHLQVDDDAFTSLLATMHHILQVSPNDFWEALGPISAIAWLQEFFNSPALSRLLSQGENEAAPDAIVDKLFSWIFPFLESMKPANRTTSCRQLVGQLMDTIQEGSYAEAVKAECFRRGLRVLTLTLHGLNQIDLSKSRLGPTTTEALEITTQHISKVGSAARRESPMAEAASDVLKQAISLDCRCFLNLDHKESQGYHSSLWQAVSRNLDYGNIVLAKKVLAASKILGGTEKAVFKDQPRPEKTDFNKTLDAVNGQIADWLDRIGDFSSPDLQTIFDDLDSIYAIISLVFSSDKDVSTGVVEMCKTWSGKTARRDALEQLLRHHGLPTTLDSVSRSLAKIELRKSFIPSARVLNPCSDIMDILCNSQSGLLRSQLSNDDAKATERFWQALWRLLTMIFSSTESWSLLGHEKHMMVGFCRDTMDFADKSFDQFGVLRGALDGADEQQAGMRLIERPKLATNVITKWLKLRDDFLVSKSCALVCKLLVRLEEFHVQLPEETLHFVVEVATDGTRSMLSQQQKAQLLRALETHSGVSFDSKAPERDATSDRKSERIDLDKWTKMTQSMDKDKKNNETVTKSSSTLTPALEKYQAMKKAGQLPTRTLPGSGTSSVSEKPKVDPSEFKRKREREMAEKKRRDALALAQHKKRLGQGHIGEGSGLSGLGVQGKEHNATPKGTGMMVSSDEEDDSEDNDMDKELFGGKGGSNIKANRPKQPSIPSSRGPVKKDRVVRSTRDMRARLAPDLSALHKTLLSWDYFHDDAFPPGSSAEDYSLVSNYFRTAHDYQKTFGPLLILEAWNGFLKAREENTAKPYPITVVLRSTVDSFLEVSSTMSHEDGKDISEGDLVLLSKARSPSSSDPHCLSRVFRITRKKAHLEIAYRAVPGTSKAGNSMTSSLTEKANIFGLKIMSVITVEREYGALHGLHYYDLCEEITEGRPSPLLHYGDERLTPIMQNYEINKAQAKAVKCAIDNDAFTLVQGPPGSGKTKTIVAITGAILTNSLQQGSTMINRPTQQVGPGAPPRKLLVCAPSNAAVDELVMRFKAGVRTIKGEDRTISVVRLGRSDAINANVQDVTLDELVNKRLNIEANKDNGRAETAKVMEEHKVVSQQLRELRTELDEADAKSGVPKEMKDRFDMLRQRKSLLSGKVDLAKDNEGAKNREADINRKKAQQAVLDGAHVICATLSGSGHDMFQNLNIEFETVIIDEAAQCVELSALIPLKYGCAKCILVGDPQQLPPTVFSKEATRFKYEQSLFVRMQSNHPKEVHLLDTQYRMHPEISAFPSKVFYESRLLDGRNMASLRTRPWHSTNLLSPFRFFDVQGQQESAGHSLMNKAEVQIAMQLYRRLISDFGDSDLGGKVGIITPYKSQLRELRDQFRRKFGHGITETVEFNTTDAFQGRESEIIIFSCVRASPGGIGFLQDIRRMNVGLTRAKSSLWVLGNSQSLMRGEFWSQLVQHAKSNQRYTSGDLETMLSRPLRPQSNGETKSQIPDLPRKPPAPADANMKTTNMNKEVVAKKGANDSRSHSIPAKRKLSADGDTDMRPPSSSSNSGSNSDSSSGDVSMPDAPLPEKASTSSNNNNISVSTDRSDPVQNKGAKTASVSRAGATQSDPAIPHPPASNARPPGQAPSVPPHMRKKKEVDVFMKKKRPRT